MTPPFNQSLDDIVIIGICLMVSALFSAIETALTSLPLARAQQISEEANPLSRLFSIWVEHPGRLLTTILIGNTILNIVASALTTLVAERHLQSTGIAIAIGMITCAVLFFSEILPKTIAVYASEIVARILLPILVVVYYALLPISVSVSRLTGMMLSALGVDRSRSNLVSQRDLDYLIRLADVQGALPKEKSRYLTSILDFSRIQIREIMIPRESMKAIEMDWDFEMLCQYVAQDGHSRYPVYRESLDSIEGFLHVKDLLKFLRQGDPQDFKLTRFLRQPFFVLETRTLNQVFNQMKRSRIHLAIVRTETNTVVGMVTLEDILEEIFGEIDDEHDDSSAVTEMDLDRGVVVDGSIQIRDLQTRHGVELPVSTDYTTLNGFLLQQLGDQPLAKKTIVIFGKYIFHVVKISLGGSSKIEIRRRNTE